MFFKGRTSVGFSVAGELNTVQTMPQYRNNATLFITFLFLFHPTGFLFT